MVGYFSLNVQSPFSDAFGRGKKGDFLAPLKSSQPLSSPSPFSVSRVYFGEKSTLHTTLAFIIFFTVRYYWFQKAISTYDSVMLGRMVLCVFRSFSGLCTQASKCLCSFLRYVLLGQCFHSWLSQLAASIYSNKGIYMV